MSIQNKVFMEMAILKSSV